VVTSQLNIENWPPFYSDPHVVFDANELSEIYHMLQTSLL
jgi:hypothetical protein